MNNPITTSTSLMGLEGQLQLDPEIRRRLGVGPGWLALQRLVDDHMEIYFAPPEHHKSLKGILAKYAKTEPLADAAWDEIREFAWRAAACNKIKGT